MTPSITTISTSPQKPPSDTNVNTSTTTTTPQITEGPPEIWVETKTDSGKSYYYHSVTRETTWTKPDNPRVKILSQAELEQMNAAKQLAQAALNPVVRRVDTRPPVLFGAPPPRFNLPPPLGMPPPGFGTAAWMLPPGTAAGQQQQQPPPATALSNLLVDPNLVAKANEWAEHKAPDGRTFYYNASKGESVWEKPEALMHLEASRIAALQQQQQMAPKPMPLMQHPPFNNHHPHLHHHPLQPPPMMTPQPSVIPPPAWMQQVLVQAEVQKRQMEERNKQEQQERMKQTQLVAAAKAPVDKSKPVSSTPISGTPWCVVWTGDGRVFFYNPSTKTSVWERPEELAERADVTKAMSTVPEQLLASNPGNVVNTTRTVAAGVTTAAVVEVKEKVVEEEEDDDDGDDDGDGEEDEGFPSKKFKGEGEWQNRLFSVHTIQIVSSFRTLGSR